ncbi:hypothetical protein M9435_001566 [Picochlorum sp. BPE23]|nr:hypothetical protein M9435_001566 [Picochlorum sp. BPE23]
MVIPVVGSAIVSRWPFRLQSRQICGCRQLSSHGQRLNDTRTPFYLAHLPRQLGVTARSSASSSTGSSGRTSVAILWFKHDFRLDDHPGVHQVMHSDSIDVVVPVYLFDPQIYARVVNCKDMARVLEGAVGSLAAKLKKQGGADLVVACGAWEETMPRIVDDVCSLYGTTKDNIRIVTEEECEVGWVDGLERVRGALEQETRVDTWTALMYHDYTEESFPEWLVARGSMTETYEDVVLSKKKAHTSLDDGSRLDAQHIWAEVGRVRQEQYLHTSRTDDDMSYDPFVVDVSSDEDTARQCIDEYIGYRRPFSPTVDAAIRRYDTQATIDGCFPAIFLTALQLGVLSRRRIHRDAVEFISASCEDALEMPIGGSPVAWAGWLLSSHGGACARLEKARKARAALIATELGDFHLGQAYMRHGKEVFESKLHYWRWRGILTDYLYSPPTSDPIPNAPAIVLVHGFGAFGEHWRRNIKELADKGFHVYAPTIPGYGRSEKHSVQYGQTLWSTFLADFISEIVTTRVVIAGNSIGGYISASVAADYPHMVAGLVLLNSAGKIDQSFTAEAAADVVRKPPPSFIVDGISRLLFTFLEGDIENQLKRLYPVRPENADEWLSQQIRRASRDPQALGVFRSVFFLPPPRPLNYLVSSLFQGPTLVLQGALDPLNDAKTRAHDIVESCPNANCILLDAGHCPHDEVPEQVNNAIASFTVDLI